MHRYYRMRNRFNIASQPKVFENRLSFLKSTTVHWNSASWVTLVYCGEIRRNAKAGKYPKFRNMTASLRILCWPMRYTPRRGYLWEATRNTLLMLHIYSTRQVEANASKCMPSRSACVAYIIQQMHVYRMYSCTRTSKLRKSSSQAIVVRIEALRNETLYGYQMYRCLKCAFR